MGIVTEHLISVVSKQVTDHGIVVWYDPERHYSTFAESLELAGTHIARFRDSFFALRHEIEPFLSGPEPARLVVYVPLDQGQTHDALVEAGAAGAVVRLPLAIHNTTLR